MSDIMSSEDALLEKIQSICADVARHNLARAIAIAIDADARALRPDDKIIEVLYAAGSAIGGLEGGANVGYVGGLSKSAITGLRAAEHAAARK